MKTKTNNKSRNRMFIIILAIVSIIYILPIFYQGMLFGDDTLFHLGRFADFCTEIDNGNLFPEILSNSYNGYGYATALFYPCLFFYPFVFLHKLGLSYMSCMMLYYITCNLATGLGYYYCFKKIFENGNEKSGEIKAFFISIIMMFDYYKFTNYYVRGAVGEFTAAIFIPFVILGLYNIFYKKRQFYILGLAMTGIVYSHIITLLIAFIFIIIFCLYKLNLIIKDVKIFFNLIKAAVICIFLSLGQIIPMFEAKLSDDLLFEHNYAVFGNVSEKLLCRFNMPFFVSIGTILLFILYSSFCRTNVHRLLQSVLLGLIVFTDILPWNYIFTKIPFGSTIQFPWRLCGFCTVIFNYFFIKLIFDNIKLVIKIFTASVWFLWNGLLCFMIISQVGIIKPYRIENNQIEQLKNIGFMEYLPDELGKKNIETRVDSNIVEYCKDIMINYEIKDINPDNQILTNISKVKNTTIINYNDNNKDNVILPIVYYPGYTIKLNNKIIKYLDSELGFIKIEDSVINGKIEIKYTGTRVQRTSRTITIISAAILILWKIRGKKNGKKICMQL